MSSADPELDPITIEGVAALQAQAASIAQKLRPGDVVHLCGELGAGKTTLARALAAAIGHDHRSVASPTFAIANHYQTPGAPDILHIDAYRLSPNDHLEALLEEAGQNRHIDPPSSQSPIVLIEWPERLGEHAPAPHLVIELAHAGPGARTLAVHAGQTPHDQPRP